MAFTSSSIEWHPWRGGLAQSFGHPLAWANVPTYERPSAKGIPLHMLTWGAPYTEAGFTWPVGLPTRRGLDGQLEYGSGSARACAAAAAAAAANGAPSASAASSPPLVRSAGAQAANAHFDELGARRHRRRAGPSVIKVGRAHLWICGEEEIDYPFLIQFEHTPLVVTCKGERVPEVDQACEAAGVPAPIHINIQHHEQRRWQFPMLMTAVTEAINGERDVIVHCRAGVHRSALVACLILIYGLATTYEEALRMVKEARPFVRLDEIVPPGEYPDGRPRGGHAYIPSLELHARCTAYWRFLPELPPSPQP